jgi:hypothetical protein
MTQHNIPLQPDTLALTAHYFSYSRHELGLEESAQIFCGTNRPVEELVVDNRLSVRGIRLQFVVARKTLSQSIQRDHQTRVVL